MKLEIRQILFGSREQNETVALRLKILRDPLGLRFSADELAAEARQIHFAAFADGRVVGCLLLAPQSDHTVKMRQVAVAERVQGRGVGKALVVFAEKWATASGYKQIILHSRETAVPFYERLGYVVSAEPFEEVTIAHRKMKKDMLAATTKKTKGADH